MFFFIRSAFWLTVVFSSMSWTVGGAPPGPHALREAFAETKASVVGAAKQAALATLPASTSVAADPRFHDLLQKAVLTPAPHESATAAVPGDERAWCVKGAAQCSSDAARLTALVAANQADDVGGDSVAPQDMEPLPPRHHGRAGGAGGLPHRR